MPKRHPHPPHRERAVQAGNEPTRHVRPERGANPGDPARHDPAEHDPAEHDPAHDDSLQRDPGKADRRIARTKQALHEALMQCLLEQEYHSISVADITNRANVGRSTFYAHYADKEDLLLESLQGLRAFLLSGQVPCEGEVHPALAWSRSMFEHILEVGPTFRMLVGRPGGSPVRAHFEAMLGEMVLERLELRPPQGSLPLPALASFIVSGFLGVATWWTSQPLPLTAGEIDALFRRQVERGMAE